MDLVVLFKIVLLQHLYGLPSLRRTLQENRYVYGVPVVSEIQLQRTAPARGNGKLGVCAAVR